MKWESKYIGITQIYTEIAVYILEAAHISEINSFCLYISLFVALCFN